MWELIFNDTWFHFRTYIAILKQMSRFGTYSGYETITRIYINVNFQAFTHLSRIIVTWFRHRHMTMILLYHWWEFWSRDTGVLIILSIFHFLGSSGLSRFPIGCVFAEYYLFIPNLTYISFGTLEITLIGLDQILKFSGFSLYPL